MTNKAQAHTNEHTQQNEIGKVSHVPDSSGQVTNQHQFQEKHQECCKEETQSRLWRNRAICHGFAMLVRNRRAAAWLGSSRSTSEKCSLASASRPCLARVTPKLKWAMTERGRSWMRTSAASPNASVKVPAAGIVIPSPLYPRLNALITIRTYYMTLTTPSAT